MKKDAIIILFLLAFYWLASLYFHPQCVVGPDEPGYFDPAASWHLGQGFTSGAWYAQTDAEFFAGNLPLHHVLAKYWFDAFGFNPLAARALNFALISLGVVFYWTALRRLKWFGIFGLILAATTVLLSEAVFYASLSGRPDAVTILLGSMTLLAFTHPPAYLSGAFLLIVGFLVALAGLQLAAASAFLLLVALIFSKGKVIIPTVVFATGGLLGGITLFVVYDMNEALPGFLASVLPNTSAGNFSIYRYTGFWLDRSLLLLWMACMGMLVFAFFKRKVCHHQLKTAMAGAIVFFGLPAFLLFLGKFSSSYTWMPIWAGTPLLVLWTVQIRKVEHGKFASTTMVVLLLVSVLLGGYPRIFLKFLTDKQPNSFVAMEQLARSHIGSDDVVVYSSPAFYAVKPLAARCFYINWYPLAMTDQDKQAANKAIIDTARFPVLENEFGGKWLPVGDPVEIQLGRFLRPPIIHTIQTYKRTE